MVVAAGKTAWLLLLISCLHRRAAVLLISLGSCPSASHTSHLSPSLSPMSSMLFPSTVGHVLGPAHLCGLRTAFLAVKLPVAHSRQLARPPSIALIVFDIVDAVPTRCWVHSYPAPFCGPWAAFFLPLYSPSFSPSSSPHRLPLPSSSLAPLVLFPLPPNAPPRHFLYSQCLPTGLVCSNNIGIVPLH